MPALVAGIVIAVPVVMVLATGLLEGAGPAWTHIRETLLVRYLGGTLSVLTLTGALCLLFAVPTAWLITMFRFPGRAVFEWLLILPLAAPGAIFPAHASPPA